MGGGAEDRRRRADGGLETDLSHFAAVGQGGTDPTLGATSPSKENLAGTDGWGRCSCKVMGDSIRRWTPKCTDVNFCVN